MLKSLDDYVNLLESFQVFGNHAKFIRSPVSID